ncbi:hypothetical protein D3C77_632610 [compost metagenome]
MTFHQGVRPGITPKIKKSIRPPENVIPILTSNKCIVMKDKPANTQCTTNNIGATNKNENSSGSVIPVKKEVSAADPIIPATNFLCWGLAS